MTAQREWPYVASHWIPGPPERRPALDRPVTCDVAIVGAGFAGLSTAYHLKAADPGLSVVLLEAEHCGFGASGKNQGVPSPHPPDGERRLRASLGLDGVRRFTQLQIGLFDAYEAFIDAHAIDCDFRRGPAAWLVTTDAQVALCDQLSTAYAEGGFPFEELSREQSRAALGIPARRGIGFGGDTRAYYDPYRFVAALRELALGVGVELHESTPVQAVEAGPPAVVRTPGGVVRADQVVLATNAYSHAFALSDGFHAVQHAYQVVTEPLGDRELEAMGWSGAYVLVNEIDPGLAFQSYRMLEDGRLFWTIGGPGFAQPDGATLLNENDAAIAYVHGELVRRFPGLRDVRVEAAWGAALDMSATHYPQIGRLAEAPNVMVAVGFSGHGIIHSFHAGRILTGLVLGDAHADPELEWLRQAYLGTNRVARERIR